jgi:5-methylcytosine-specific restriction enzyme subunit McrC
LADPLTLQGADKPLQAYTPALVDLEQRDAHFLQTNAPQLGVERPVDGRGYVINPRQYVGVVALPSGTRLAINPRISGSNVFYMLAVAYQFKSPFFQERERYETADELLEQLAEFFVDLTQERIEEGLHRSYLDTEANLHLVRGRIDFPRDVAHNSVLRHHVYCRYSEFTWDIPENQVLRYVAYHLSGWNFRRRDLVRRLTSLYNQLDEVTRVPFTVAQVNSFIYHRHNEGYRRVHRLCALFLEGMSLSERSGVTQFQTFLLDMNKLFEEFVTQEMIDRFDAPWIVKRQYRVDLDDDQSIHMRPDLVFFRHGRVHVVADCKYKPISQGEFMNHDYYQLLAYCTRLDTRLGILIYPRHEVSVEDVVTISESRVSIRRLSLDLSLDPAQLGDECDRLADEVSQQGMPHFQARRMNPEVGALARPSNVNPAATPGYSPPSARPRREVQLRVDQ